MNASMTFLLGGLVGLSPNPYSYFGRILIGDYRSTDLTRKVESRVFRSHSGLPTLLTTPLPTHSCGQDGCQHGCDVWTYHEKTAGSARRRQYQSYFGGRKNTEVLLGYVMPSSWSHSFAQGYRIGTAPTGRRRWYKHFAKYHIALTGLSMQRISDTLCL